MTDLQVALTISCVVATAALLVAERTESRLGRSIAKPIASLSFVGVALATPQWGTFPWWIGVGLVLGAAGDIALLGESRRQLLVGIVLFLGGHVAYVIGFIPLGEFGTRAILVLVTAAAVGAFMLQRLWNRVGSLRLAVVAYVVVIIAMVTAALATDRPMIALGGLLFFVSDLAVARQRFIIKSFVNKAWGLPTYYAGQLLIAWSAASLAV